MAGATRPVTYDDQSRWQFGSSFLLNLAGAPGILFGPYNSPDASQGSVPNDGVVPTDSALGIDPITGQPTNPGDGAQHTRR